MLDLTNHFTGTYTKIILGDWPVISDFIKQETAWIKVTVQALPEDKQLIHGSLTDQQIDDALNGPLQSFFKLHLRAYTAIAKVETALTLSKEDYFKESEHINQKVFAVPERLLASTEIGSLKELRKQLDEKTKEHYAQWQTQIHHWTKELLQAFEKNNLKLSDLEQQEFSANQPASELHDRFIDLKINLPKLSKSDFDFQQYFTLKALLAIHSTLNRMQQARTEKDIEQQLKALQPILKVMVQTEKTLSETQEKAVGQLIAKIVF